MGLIQSKDAVQIPKELLDAYPACSAITTLDDRQCWKKGRLGSRRRQRVAAVRWHRGVDTITDDDQLDAFIAYASRQKILEAERHQLRRPYWMLDDQSRSLG